MNREIEINKFNRSITFQNRGIGFTQIGIADEILNLIDDLQQENKQLKERIDKAIEYINSVICKYDNYEPFVFMSEEEIKKLLEILGDKENE